MNETPPPGVRVIVEGDKKIVYRTHLTRDAGEVTVRQDFPDALEHHYSPRGIGEDIPIYAGQFELRAYPGSPLQGDVRFTWNPTPRLMARGQGEVDILDALLGADDAPKWVRMGDVHLDASRGLPSQPDEANASSDNATASTWIEDRIASPNIGDGSNLDFVTFFIPNGWQGFDGSHVRDAAEPWIWWRGSLTAEAAGWRVRIDPCRGHSDRYWAALKESGSSRVTHVARLSRADGSQFSSDDIETPTNAIRLALSLAVGRSVQCLLPVGWRNGRAVWALWHCGGVDRMRGVHTLLDPTVAAAQLKQLIEASLRFCEDPYREEVFQYATSYYLTANYDVNAELAVALPVSALQLLAYYRFVEDRKTFSRGEWKGVTTEQEIRKLLEDCKLDLALPSQSAHFQDVQAALPAADDGNPRDALGCIVKMRKNVIHPTRDKPKKWTAYQWMEAAEVALDYLRFAILNEVGYSGSIRATIQSSKQTGALTEVPWSN